MKLIKIKNFPDRLTADQAQQRLKEEGIESVIQSLDVGVIGSFGGALPQGADIYVREEEAERARNIMKEFFGEV